MKYVEQLKGTRMLQVFRIEQAEQWDRIVCSFKEYDIYWLSKYVKAFQLHGDGDPLLFFYEDGNIRGINVVMKRDIAEDERFIGKIPKERFFDFSTPYGYGGWLLEGDNHERLFEEYKRWVEKNGIISEFVRYHPMIQNQRWSKSFYEVVKLGEVVHMELSSPEIIWNNLTSKNRNVIRKAQKNGVHIYNGRFPEIYKEFRQIYNKTMDKDDAKEYYYFGECFYDSVLEDLSHNAQVFYAEKDNHVIAASIVLAINGRMNYHLSGSLSEFSSLAPNNLLLYEAAMWGCANGYKTLYLGGGVGSENDSLFKFKRAFFRGSLNHFYIGKKVYSDSLYSNLANIRGECVNKSFFPLYRG